MSGHTAGPWKIADSDCSGGWVENEDGIAVHDWTYKDHADPETFIGEPDHARAFANARLIAAAPDCFELLAESVLDLEFFVALAGTAGFDERAENTSRRLGKIRAAIAKATGAQP